MEKIKAVAILLIKFEPGERSLVWCSKRVGDSVINRPISTNSKNSV